MQIKIKTQDTEIEYSDEYSKLEPNTAETLFKLVDKIREKQRCQYCGAYHQGPIAVENKIREPVIFGVPNNSAGMPIFPPTFTTSENMNMNLSTDSTSPRTTTPPEHLDQYIKQRSEWDRTVQR